MTNKTPKLTGTATIENADGITREIPCYTAPAGVSVREAAAALKLVVLGRRDSLDTAAAVVQEASKGTIKFYCRPA